MRDGGREREVEEERERWRKRERESERWRKRERDILVFLLITLNHQGIVALVTLLKCCLALDLSNVRYVI